MKIILKGKIKRQGEVYEYWDEEEFEIQENEDEEYINISFYDEKQRSVSITKEDLRKLTNFFGK